MILVVNMIPKALSGETNQDSEPNLAVNPANPLQIVGTAFTPDPMGGMNAPIYISQDGGNSWSLNSIVPSTPASGSGTSDITVAFGSSGNKLYAGILKATSDHPMEVLRTTSFSNSKVMKQLTFRPGPDQPFAHARTVTNGAGTSKDLLLVGDNDLDAPSGHTATIDITTNAGGTKPSFKSIRLDSRSNGVQAGPQIRPIAHADGTLYAAYYGWRAMNGPNNNLVITSDVVVVRDDHGGRGTKPFKSLLDPGDNLPGRRVAQGVRFPFIIQGGPGQQRVGGALSIAVDPNNSSLVYLAWADGQANNYTIHVRRSSDRGLTWSVADLLPITAHSTNPSIAVNGQGEVALLYQQLTNQTGSHAAQRWVTHLTRSMDGQNWNDIVLANVPAFNPAKLFDPYIGDYNHLLAVGNDFYGVFSTSNVPDHANFPNGVVYARNADFNTHTLLNLDNATPVGSSIDPFFLKVTPN